MASSFGSTSGRREQQASLSRISARPAPRGRRRAAEKNLEHLIAYRYSVLGLFFVKFEAMSSNSRFPRTRDVNGVFL
jgi:hypothetical protein